MGSIVPLPGMPTAVERGGDWTLQRLRREIPGPRVEFQLAAGAASAHRAEVLQQVQVDALDITILKGGSDAVGRWAVDHGFLLTPDAPEVLSFYAVEGYEGHIENFEGGYTVAFEKYTADADLTPFFKGVPNDQCQATHWAVH